MVFSGQSVDEVTGGDFGYPSVTGSKEYYSRSVEAVNRTVVFVEESLFGETVAEKVDEGALGAASGGAEVAAVGAKKAQAEA